MKTTASILAVLIALNTASTFAQPGSPDSTFSKDGKLSSPILSNSSSVAIQPDGKILAESGFSVVRFDADGKLDKDFGVDGKASTSFEGYNEGYLMALQSNGKIIVAGYSINDIDVWLISLARFTKKGTLDSSFGINGKVTYEGSYYIPTALAIAPDGKIVVSCRNAFYFETHVYIVEFNPDGSLYNIIGRNDTYRDFPYALAIQPNGKIIVTGSIIDEQFGNAFTLWRFQIDGNPDNNFGTSGKTTLKYGAGLALALSPEGKIVAVASDSILARFNKDGVRDDTFGKSGKIKTAFQGKAVAVQPDGNIILIETISNGLNNDFVIARYKPNGKLNKAFGINGIATTDFHNKDDGANALALQADGKIVVAGHSDSNCAITRYNYNDAAVPEKISDNNFSLSKNTNILSTIKIAPNPVKDILHIEGLNFSTANAFTIVDAAGRVMQQITDSKNTHLINVSQLPAGIYYLRIEENKNFITLKFVKE